MSFPHPLGPLQLSVASGKTFAETAQTGSRPRGLLQLGLLRGRTSLDALPFSGFNVIMLLKCVSFVYGLHAYVSWLGFMSHMYVTYI